MSSTSQRRNEFRHFIGDSFDDGLHGLAAAGRWGERVIAALDHKEPRRQGLDNRRKLVRPPERIARSLDEKHRNADAWQVLRPKRLRFSGRVQGVSEKNHPREGLA